MRLLRLYRIFAVVARYRLDLLAAHDKLPRWLGFIIRFGPWRLASAPAGSNGERLRLALESLGPIFIKFGQLLSTRPDLVPADIAAELSKLQDQVPPFPEAESIALIERALGKPTRELFAEFNATPMASASIAQVHGARLHSGREVVVKVVRPGIRKVIEKDIGLLFTLARFVERYIPDGKRLRPVEVVTDYRNTILDELDMQREAANTSQLRRNFAESELLYVPEVFFDYTRRDVLVMERIDGIPVTDMAALQAQKTDLKVLAERGVEIFFTQVFRDSFFHADMHPGNIFVAKDNPASPQYIAVDCAIIGSLSDDEQQYLARILLAMFKHDYRKVAELHIECGWIAADVRVTEFEAAIRSVCEPIFEKPLGQISFGHLLVNLFTTARRFDMEVQPSLVLLQKTLLNIEGLGRQLYPELDLWQTAMPFLERWLAQQYAPKQVLPKLADQLMALVHALPQTSAAGSKPGDELAALRRQIADEQRRNRRWRQAGLAATAGIAIAALPAAGLIAQIPAASWLLLGVAAILILRS